MLTQFDDYPIHQTPEPIAHKVSSERNLYDRYWFNGYDRDGEFYIGIAMALYPNLGIPDCGLSTLRDRDPHPLPGRVGDHHPSMDDQAELDEGERDHGHGRQKDGELDRGLTGRRPAAGTRSPPTAPGPPDHAIRPATAFTTRSNNSPTDEALEAHPITSRAMAAAPRITRAYSAVACSCHSAPPAISAATSVSTAGKARSSTPAPSPGGAITSAVTPSMTNRP